MSYHHLTTFERGRIQALLALGYSNRSIAQNLNRHRSCIDREIHRNVTGTGYVGEAAQSAYDTRRMHSKPKGKRTEDLVAVITDKLLATWSPEQIANTVTLGIISFKTIYNWICTGEIPCVTVQNLRQKGKRKKAEKRGKFSMGTPISERPEDVKSRDTFGHWELDSMVSSRGESKGCFATFVERKSRLYTAFKTPDRTAASMQAAITGLYNTLPKGAFRTGTTDRGKEFACCTAIREQLGLTLYLPMPTRRGNVGVTKTLMACCESFTQRKQISH